ncbi:MAG: acyltransferase, partial [Sphingomonas sp.]|nr:acyltransferase [Sphingomonas sp.]
MHEQSGGDGMVDPSQSDRTTISYRPDIDGLRAIAILPILLLHCGVSAVRGGFVGVDIFFVISGYLITAIIRRDLATDDFSIGQFLRHRIVRILPALFAMLTIVLIAGCVILLPNQIRELANSVVWASLFVSNVYFYQTSDYFAAASDAKPLIHIWSLAVEEQFYLFYPWFLMLLRHLSQRNLVRVMVGLATASFAMGGVLAITDPAAAFFLLPGRIWELALGGLVAMRAFPLINHRYLRNLICVAAMTVIAASCLVIGIRWTFPVPFALASAAAAALLIAYGEDGPTARLLSFMPLRTIGLLSYSLYLWHRPIISFYQLEFGSTLQPTDSALLVAACFGAAATSYWLVERPAIKRWRSGRQSWPHIAAFGALSCGVLVGLLVATHANSIRPLPPRLSRIANYLGHDTTPAGRRQFSLDRCFSIPTRRPYDLACMRLSAHKPNIVLLGDSHAAHLSQALREARRDANIVQATAAGCLPLLHGGGLSSCRNVMDHAFAEIDFAKAATIILSARWLRGDEAALQETIAYLQKRGGKVVVLGPS